MKIRICVIDDTDEGERIVNSAFADTDSVLICGGFAENADITVCFSENDHILKNIRPGSSVILSSNRPVKTNVALRLIICGLYEKATVTASSVRYTENGTEFVYCLQRAVMTLTDKYAEIGEIKVCSEWGSIEKALAAVTARVIAFGNTDDTVFLKKP